ncbi:DUF5786 family protein [Halocatena pleomorpha]|uniref:Death domain-associated protein n=1 Tax=Halocatena pleomorpha TaxID=1785090 RepID=A0A3P3RDJ5_9EURY|nr:DUF5786 family protein [Halocatena pleomorpha]RRJ31394.1 death domain-associated protein [Halocatena pleomorpha]
MGFGSYDESEQKNQEMNTDDTQGVNVHENEHEGELTFESQASTDDLVDQLQAIKSTVDDE